MYHLHSFTTLPPPQTSVGPAGNVSWTDGPESWGLLLPPLHQEPQDYQPDPEGKGMKGLFSQGQSAGLGVRFSSRSGSLSDKLFRGSCSPPKFMVRAVRWAQ